MAEPDGLTPTSYALLCQMQLRPFSTYELAQQMTRNAGELWPRAERAFYYEAKKLARMGLAEARAEPVGGRKRTVYSATESGVKAVREWLASRDIAPPQVESEALLRLWFAEFGTKDDLLAAVANLREHAERMRDAVYPHLLEEYADTGGAFPQRLHLNALTNEWLSQYAALLMRYSEWVEEVVADWDRVDSPEVWPEVRAYFRAVLEHPPWQQRSS